MRFEQHLTHQRSSAAIGAAFERTWHWAQPFQRCDCFKTLSIAEGVTTHLIVVRLLLSCLLMPGAAFVGSSRVILFGLV